MSETEEISLSFGVLKQLIRYKEGNEAKAVIGEDANAYGPAQESLVILGVWTMLMFFWFGQCSCVFFLCVCVCVCVCLAMIQRDFLGGSNGKESTCNAGDPGLIPGLERSPGEWNGNPLQFAYLENPMNTGAWRATVNGVAKSQTMTE